MNLFVSVLAFRGAIDLYWGYFAYLIILPKFLKWYSIPRNLILILATLFLIGTVYSLLGLNDFMSHFKIMVGLTASYLFFYFIVFKTGISIKTLFRFYCQMALIMASIGIVQMISYVLGDPLGTELISFFGYSPLFTGGTSGLRVCVFFGEPSYYAMFMSAAVFLAIHDFIFQKKRFYFNRITSIILLVGVYFSYSGTLPATIGISLLLILLNYGFLKYAFLLLPIAFIGLTQILNSNDEFSGRYDSTLDIFKERPNKEFNVLDYNGSSVILYNNFHVAFENFKRNPLFGTGIGSHPIAFKKYSLTKHVRIPGFNLNQKDANSMFNRLMSETGLFGFVIFGWLIFGHYVSRKKSVDAEWLISNACLVLILINLVRQGHFFLAGFPFYIWMYYAAWQSKKTSIDEVR